MKFKQIMSQTKDNVECNCGESNLGSDSDVLTAMTVM
jgi:hypothetical protein